jgi:hypothetical protein
LSGLFYARQKKENRQKNGIFKLKHSLKSSG